jgi:hypothetical protein
MELITSVTVGSGGAASVTLPATGTIPATYTDLKIVASIRATSGGTINGQLRFNSSTSGYSERLLYGDGSSAASANASTTSIQWATLGNGATSTASTFSNNEIYIPNYTSANFKSVSTESVTENNATAADIYVDAGLWSNTAAITTIELIASSSSFAEGSTFYLYGISSVTSTPKATGGIVSQDATYWYHTFPFTSTFTPTAAISADILCVAGGGGGGGGGGNGPRGGGGGAGGLLAYTSQSLTAINYAITVGAGGAGGSGAQNAPGNQTSGSNSQFGSLTASAGGGRAAGDSNGASQPKNGTAGGSGGGAATFNTATTGTGGAASPSGQGNKGGDVSGQSGGSNSAGAGGGGAGAAGGNITAAGTATAGGVGSSTYSSWGAATGTGENSGGTYYYAGGGGGCAVPNNVNAAGGLGGGSAGNPNANASAATVNTVGGGGGSSGLGGAGGSGIIIVRYAK